MYRRIVPMCLVINWVWLTGFFYQGIHFVNFPSLKTMTALELFNWYLEEKNQHLILIDWECNQTMRLEKNSQQTREKCTHHLVYWSDTWRNCRFHTITEQCGWQQSYRKTSENVITVQDLPDKGESGSI